MAVLPMEKITIWAMQRDRKAILEKLQLLGIVELRKSAEPEPGFFRIDTAGQKRQFEQEAQLADEAVALLKKYAPNVPAEKADRGTVLAAGAFLKNAKQQIEADRAELLSCEKKIEELQPWEKLELPMNFSGTKHTTFLLGTLPIQKSIEQEALLAVLQEAVPAFEVLEKSRAGLRLAILCGNREAQAVEALLKHRGFVKAQILCEKIPHEKQEELRAHIAELNARIKDLQEKIRSYGKYCESFQELSDYFRTRARKYEALGDLQQTERIFTIEGYVPKRELVRLKEALSCYACVQLDREPLEEKEEPPVLLENPKITASAEGILASYGLPNRGETDPTGIMAVFYIFLFGLMLADAAYGFLICAVCFYLLHRFPQMEESLKKSLRLFGYCGISTLVWGILFGGYFGDALQVISEKFFHRKLLVPALWFAPLDNPMKMLLYSMAFGLVHLFAGLGMKGYLLLRKKRWQDFFCEVVLWYVLLIGLLLLLLSGELFASISGIPTAIFPTGTKSVAKLLAAAGAVGIFLTAGRKSRQLGVRLALGLYGLYGVTGWLSDVLSYSRLLALGLATGVIASVVNQMAAMLGNGVIGAVLFVVVFLIGHSFNLAINILGAYVHTNRLQYVEFFGKFYEGGGRAFAPFRAERNYVERKEKN